ncbi:MAG: heme-binding protein, partial [Chitinophagaceae bacterium]|nr:heme-binding protein [Rubrivivax sp.]
MPKPDTRKLGAMLKPALPALLLSLALTPCVSQAIEEPVYEVVRQIGEQIELRRYAGYVVAEVVLDANAAEAGSQAFPILAGYIFGKNKGRRKLEMTAPVTQSA